MLTPSKLVGERFNLRRRIGEGGFGVVYEAYDEERQATVALKLLHRAEPAALLRFKREFRTLADISHDNLVQLFELIADGDQWFLTMEFVEGVNLLGGVAMSGSQELADTVDADSGDLVGRSAGPRVAPEPFPEPVPETVPETVPEIVPETGPIPIHRPIDAEKLRDALRQLALGLNALHDHGILHRDIKPSNVLVDPYGRLVILDFGMVAELRPVNAGPGKKASFVGTPHYTSPEQAMGEDATEASDWYSVGVMLHEAMIGSFPVDGRSVVQILLAKQKPHSPAIEDFPDGSPEDLVDLCRSLLSLNPLERPTGHDVVRRLDISEVTSSSTSNDEVFVGRLDELAELDHARRRVRTARRPGVVNVQGRSGMGKSALMRQFISGLDDSVVLVARCYENESVPYKAVDGLVDDIYGHLKSLDSAERAEAVAGVDLDALARLFPVMRQLYDEAPASPFDFDQMNLRQRAFEALRSLLVAMSDMWSVVLWIDDAQWGDRDSAALLSELIRGSDSPPVLWVATFRSEDVEQSSFLPVWAETLQEHAEHIDIASIQIGELSNAEARDLASALLDGHDDATTDIITREAKGHPFFIDELARFRRFRKRVDSSIESLDDFIRYRFDHLDRRARKLLETVSVAGQPIEWNTARDVARLGEAAPAVFARLRNDRLLRVNTRDNGEFVETYHDRIRETVRDSLSEDRRVRYHVSIAETLESNSSDDWDLLRVHFREGREHDRAAKYAVLTAEQAMNGLAFEKAIEAFEEAIELKDWPRPERLEFLRQIGDANAFLARGNEAADAFRGASHIAESEQVAIDLERKAAEQLIRCGQLERGMASMKHVMERLGLPTPSDKTLTLGLIWRAIKFTLRGGDYELSGEALSPLEKARVDACWSLANLMATIDVKRGAYYQIVNLTVSLDSGDPTAICQALGLQAVHDATTPKHRDRAPVRLAEALELAKLSATPDYQKSWIAFATGLVDYMGGDFTNAIDHFEHAVELLDDHGSGSRWEAASIELYSLQCLFFVGELGEFTAMAMRLIEEAEWARDFLHLIAVGLWSHIMYLAAGEPVLAQTKLDDSIEGWADQNFHLQDFWYLKGSANVAIYEGRGREAHRQIVAQWRDLGAAMILRSETGLVTAWDVRMRTAICVAIDGDRATARKELKRARRAVSKWKPAWGMALLDLHAASLALLDGDPSAVEQLAEAEAACDATGMRFWALAARLLLGLATRGGRGETLRDSVVKELGAEGVADPVRFLSVFAPAIRSFDRLLPADT